MHVLTTSQPTQKISDIPPVCQLSSVAESLSPAQHSGLCSNSIRISLLSLLFHVCCLSVLSCSLLANRKGIWPVKTCCSNPESFSFTGLAQSGLTPEQLNENIEQKQYLIPVTLTTVKHGLAMSHYACCNKMLQ